MKWIKRLGPYVVVLTIIVILLRQIDPVEVVRLLVSADPRWLLVSAGAYAFTNLIRAFRFNALLNLHAAGRANPVLGPVAMQDVAPGDPSGFVGESIAAVQLLPEMFALSFLNNTLPSRSGELSFPYFMWRRHRLAVGESTAALIVVRIFDYMAVAVLYVVCASANLYRLSANATKAVWAVGLLLVVSLAVLLLAPWFGQHVIDGLRALIRRWGVEDRRVPRVGLNVAQQAVDHFRRIRSVRAYAITMAWSLLTWIGTFAWFGAAMQGIGVGQPFGLVVVGATFASLAKAVPFITVGGFGAHEAGWTVGFSLVGMPVATAIASGFAVNILTLVMSVIFGGTALIVMHFQERRLAAVLGKGQEGPPSLVIPSPAPDDRASP
jgi:glycosyltransferase 2 family protein